MQFAATIAGTHPARKCVQNSRSDAMRAPSPSAASLAHTTSSATRRWPAEVSNPQSVPACTRVGSPTASATRSMRSAMVFGCSTKLVTEVDHAGDDYLVGIEREIAQHRIFVRMARVGERQHEAADVQLAQDRHDLVQLHVAVVRTFVVAPARVQANAFARDVDQRRVDRGDDAVDEAEKVAERSVLVRHMSFHREIGTVELQQEAVPDDRLVFDAQRLAEGREISVLARIVIVAQRGGDDARRGRGQERLGERVAEPLERGAEIAALGVDRGAIQIADVAGRGWHVVAAADHYSIRQVAFERRLERRIVFDVAARRAGPTAAETAHAGADIQEERFPLLFAVVADVDAGVLLAAHDTVQRGAPGLREFRIDRLAAVLA